VTVVSSESVPGC